MQKDNYYGQPGPYNPPPAPGFVNAGPSVYADAGAAEAAMGGYGNFSDIRVRHQFIRKVYSLVSLQLLITSVFIAVMKLVPAITQFVAVNSWILWLSMIGTIVIVIMLACCESMSRSYPLNLILLMIFTVLESLLLGCISSQYKTDTLLIAAGLTAFVVVGITIFAFQTKIDFTGIGEYTFHMKIGFFH